MRVLHSGLWVGMRLSLFILAMLVSYPPSPHTPLQTTNVTLKYVTTDSLLYIIIDV